MSKRLAAAAGVLAAAGLVLSSVPASAGTLQPNGASDRNDNCHNTSTCSTNSFVRASGGTLYLDYVLYEPVGSGRFWAQISFPTGTTINCFTSIPQGSTKGSLPCGSAPSGTSVWVSLNLDKSIPAMIVGWHQD